MSESIRAIAVTRRPSLVDLAWRQNAASSPILRNVLLVAVGSLLLTLSAKINVPLPFVPMTLQTLVVLVIGMAYGSRIGAATVLAYLAEGAIGLPVFAGPIGGLAYMMGPTGGYLAGFVVAAFLAGMLGERGFDRTILRVFAVMMLGHFIIVGFGALWLGGGLGLGADKAWIVGVLPFIAGSVVKSALGAALVPGLHRAAARRK